jgi:hypothetical protein
MEFSALSTSPPSSTKKLRNEKAIFTVHCEVPFRMTARGYLSKTPLYFIYFFAVQ